MLEGRLSQEECVFSIGTREPTENAEKLKGGKVVFKKPGLRRTRSRLNRTNRKHLQRKPLPQTGKGPYPKRSKLSRNKFRSRLNGSCSRWKCRRNCICDKGRNNWQLTQRCN